MSPTLRNLATPLDLDVVRPMRTPRVAALYAFGLLAVALALVAVLCATGHALPAPGLLLVLAIPLALCMNRYLFFPNEVGVTADAAVLFAAVVAFRGDAQWLGPLMLALLAGPLDARHWGARAFARMAYNSGSTALVTAIALALFVPLSHEFGSAWEATLAATVVAAIPYLAAETSLGVVLVTLLGERPRDAFRHQLPLNLIALPLAVLGAAAGVALVDVGWWLCLLLLLGAPVLPELLFVVVPRRVGRSLVGAVVAAALLASTPFVSGELLRAGVGIAALLILAGMECPPRRSVSVPLTVAVCACVAVAVALGEVSFGAVIASASAGCVVLVLGARDRRAWSSLPIVAVAASLGALSVRLAPLTFVVFALATTTGLVVAASWGPLPWSSRYLGPFASRVRAVVRHASTGVVAATALAAVVAAAAAPEPARSVSALTATALLETLATAALLAVRFWRFAPRRRRVELGALALSAAVAMLVYLPAALAGSKVAVIVGGVVLLVPLAVLGALSGSLARLGLDRGACDEAVSEQLEVAHRE